MRLKPLCSNFLICGLICFLLITASCNDNKNPSIVSSTVPDKEQLQKSNFVKFINQLKDAPEEQRTTLVNSFINEYKSAPIIEDSTLACFYWFGDAKEVLINSDVHYGSTIPDSMDVIKCKEKNFFYKLYSLPADARIDYHFIADGKTVVDSLNKIITPSGYGFHSQCAMPLFKPNPVRQFNPEINHGTLDTVFFNSKLSTMQPRRILIYKPAGYDSLSNLPALYVNDGFKAIEYCGYLNVLDNLIANRIIKPVLVVFIDFVEGDQDYFINRTDEYITALCKELVPMTDEKYKTSKTARDRVLAGISAGAHISILTALKQPDIFLNAAGQSTTVLQDIFDAIQNVSSNKDAIKSLKFYVDVGRFDLVLGGMENYPFLYANQLMHKEMNKHSINNTFKVVNDGHQWASWRERIDQILIFFFAV